MPPISLLLPPVNHPPEHVNRLELYQRLSSLPSAQLDQVIFALKPPSGNISSPVASPSSRVNQLLEWAESPIGCGLEGVVRVVEDIDRRYKYTLPENRPPSRRHDSDERDLIHQVQTEIGMRLQQSLHNDILQLNMEERRDYVERPWEMQLRITDQTPQELQSGTHIADVFDRRDVGGRLLILGDPGSGKTTTMVDLATVLIKRAYYESEQSIPVMFNLSSWQDTRQNINDWLLSELKSKYGVKPEKGKIWLEERKLLPLLDALDELPPRRQEPVVQAINEWLESGNGPTRLSVCSRVEEYELYASRLRLNGAIYLEPLTDKQLQTYLKLFGR